MYPPDRISQFQGLHNLTLFFPSNGGADATRICYIGLKVRALCLRALHRGHIHICISNTHTHTHTHTHTYGWTYPLAQTHIRRKDSTHNETCDEERIGTTHKTHSPMHAHTHTHTHTHTIHPFPHAYTRARLKGEFTRVVRDTIITVAEVAANPSDHPKLSTKTAHSIQ